MDEVGEWVIRPVLRLPQLLGHHTSRVAEVELSAAGHHAARVQQQRGVRPFQVGYFAGRKRLY